MRLGDIADIAGKISLDEFKDAGKDSLPVIGDFKDLGHHYDEESE